LEGDIAKLLAELRQNDLASRTGYTSSQKDEPPLGNLRRVAATYQKIFLNSDHDLAIRLHYIVCLLEFHVSRYGIEHVLRIDDDFDSDAERYFEEHADEFDYLIKDAEPPGTIEAMVFNYLMSGFARVDEELRSKSFLTGRVGRIVPILKFIMSKGSLRTLSREYPDTIGLDAFSVLDDAVLDWESHKILERYAAVQFSSLHFCGNPGPDLTFEEGVRHLVLAVLVTISLAAFHAADERRRSEKNSDAEGNGRLFVTGAHTSAALKIVDHTFYHSPFFALRHVRKMTRWLISERHLPSILKLLSNTSGDE
jgi:hypothetical protein